MSQHQCQQIRQRLRNWLTAFQGQLAIVWPGRVAAGPRSLARHRPRRSSRRAVAPLDWVIPGKLAVGGLPQPGDRDRFKQANIQVILSLTAPMEAELPPEVTASFRCARVALPDSRYEAQLRVERLATAVDVVHRALTQQLPIYVHCLAGIERSPLVCIAYLCRYYQLDLWEALYWLKQVRPCVAPTTAQLNIVQHFLQQSENCLS
ncbi:dual specificity protein phosphatase family protein [Trichothermofontia sichuanensis B231]|uniref:dual specificity protein phosphatase family protein n=1 Tax=Trichothermofontia sichuanensis TaxID=3045816 RepID=UPI00224764EF|nr:dual specificity protein phosphatase [Trichothermofontia sichuanensis]UZQ54919.1 dual specificity protein phosphatase family protein [Trichothermofontia sichuanensis B231]